MPRPLRVLAVGIGAAALLQPLVVAGEWLLWQIHMRRIARH